MKIPESNNSTSALIDKWHEDNQEGPRPHLGASMLGHPCDRWLWLSFRHAVIEKFSGRMLRLFRRGQNEEKTILDDLRAIGIDITADDNGKQFRVDFGSHVSGSMDGVIKIGVPESPKKPHIAEFKTHSDKSFNDLKKEGVQKSKPAHYIQMQVYMHGTGIDRALYVAVNKNTDELYTERVRYDKRIAENAINRGYRIALSDRMPEPMSGASASWYQCKFCAGYDFCYESKITKEVNCRTCIHSTAMEDSTWRCDLHKADNIPFEFQRTGCDSHVLHLDLVPWKIDMDLSTEQIAAYVIDGKLVRNGKPDDKTFSSVEILAGITTRGDNNAS